MNSSRYVVQRTIDLFTPETFFTTYLPELIIMSAETSPEEKRLNGHLNLRAKVV